jgi:hypothetical protein
MSADFLTRIQEDWDCFNLAGIQFCLQQAYELTDALTNPERNAHFATPNRHMIAGTMRWGLVDKCLHDGCLNGRLRGIQPRWVPLSSTTASGVHALELIGRNTCVTPFHLTDVDEAPRESSHRAEMRLFNQLNPLLPTFAEEQVDTISLLNLILIHGDKKAEFAFLRAYHDPDERGAYVPVSDNIMRSPALISQPVDAEEIAEAEIQLKPVARKAAGQSDNQHA